MKLGCVGLFVNYIKKMVKFYRDVMKLEIDWDGDCFTGVNIDGKFFFNLCDIKTMDPENNKEINII